MPGSAVAGGNELFDTLIYVTITPPATITTATTTTTTTTVNGVVVGDLLSWNQVVPSLNALISVTNMYVSAANTVTSTWSTEGATVNGAAALQFLISVIRPNIVPYTALPNGIY